MRKDFETGHDGLGQQLAPVDHPPGATVTRTPVAMLAHRLDVEHRHHVLEVDTTIRAHRPDTAGVATPTRRSTASWKNATYPPSLATSENGSS